MSVLSAGEDDPRFAREAQSKSEAARIAEYLGGKRVGIDSYYADCLLCGYEEALAITAVGSRTLFFCHAGCGSLPVFEAVRELGLLDARARSSAPSPIELSRVRKARHVRERSAMVEDLWAKSVVLSDSPGEAYLRSRGITIDLPASLRFLRKTRHKPSQAWLPCLLAGVTHWPSDNVVALHRTFLAPDAKTKTLAAPAKMSLGPIGGGAVRLGNPVADTLTICEGIETGLSFMQLSGIPVWACLSTGGMQAVTLPPTVRHIIIAADNDGPGLEAAEAVLQRYQGHFETVEVVKPDTEGQDFNDVLVSREFFERFMGEVSTR